MNYRGWGGIENGWNGGIHLLKIGDAVSYISYKFSLKEALLPYQGKLVKGAQA